MARPKKSPDDQLGGAISIKLRLKDEIRIRQTAKDEEMELSPFLRKLIIKGYAAIYLGR